jgi:adenosine deaminase
MRLPCGKREFDLFETLRQRVLDELVRRELIVESCPSSNLAVANLAHAPTNELLKHTGLRVAIATDDDVLIGTDLQRERGYVEGDKRTVIETTRCAAFVRAAR